MSGIIDCEMHIGDEVFVHGYIDEIRKDTIIIRNVGGYFGTSRDEVFYYEEDGSMTEANQTEPSDSENPNDCEDEPLTCDGNCWMKKQNGEWLCEHCQREPKDDHSGEITEMVEPQTDPCDGCVCDDGKHLMYCMNCKGIAWKTEPPKVETEPQTCANGCKWLDQDGECTEPNGECHIEYRTQVDEPQTDCAWKKGE